MQRCRTLFTFLLAGGCLLAIAGPGICAAESTEGTQVAGDLVARGMAALARNQLADSVRFCEAAVVLEPKEANAWFYLGLACSRSYLEQDQHDPVLRNRALAAFEQYLALRSTGPDADLIRREQKRLQVPGTAGSPAVHTPPAPKRSPAPTAKEKPARPASPGAAAPVPVPTPVRPVARRVLINSVVAAGISPISRGEQVFLPAKATFQATGAHLQYFPESMTVHITRGSTTCFTILGSLWATVNGRAMKLNAPAVMEKGRLLVPLDFVGAALDAAVKSDSRTGNVHISWNATPSDPVSAAPPAVETPAIQPTGPCTAAPPDPQVIRWRRTTSNEVRALAASPDGNTVAAGSWRIRANASNTPVGEIQLWDLMSGRLLHTLLGHWAGVNALAFSPEGMLLASAAQDSTVALWRLPKGERLPDLKGQPHAAAVIHLSFAPDGVRLISVDVAGEVKIWNLQTRSLEKSFLLEGHQKPVRCVAVSWSMHRILTGSEDQTVRLWNLEDGSLQQIVATNRGAVGAVGLAPHGSGAGSANFDGVWLWPLEPAPDPLGAGTNPLGEGGQPRGDNIAPPGGPATAPETASKTRGLGSAIGQSAHRAAVHCLAFAPDGNCLASGGDDNQVVVWDLNTRTEHILTAHKAPLGAVIFTACGVLVSGDSDGNVFAWK